VAELAHERERIRREPRALAQLEHERPASERLRDPAQTRLALRAAPERVRELHEQRGELLRVGERLQARMEGAYLRVALAGILAERLVREDLLQLGGEAKLRALVHELGPVRAVPRARSGVERRVDLDAVEVTRELPQGMEALGLLARIHPSLPVGIGPASRADADHRAP